MEPNNLIEVGDYAGGVSDDPVFIQAALQALVAGFEQEFSRKGRIYVFIGHFFNKIGRCIDCVGYMSGV
jgi:hypothetical protein